MTISGHALRIPLRVGEDQRRAPRAAVEEPPLDAEVLAQPLHVGDQVVGRVGGHVDGGVARVREAAAAATLVEQDDPVSLGVEVAAASGAAARAGAAVHDERRLAGRVAARLPVDEVAVADVEQPVVVRLDRRERRHVSIIVTEPASADKLARPCMSSRALCTRVLGIDEGRRIEHGVRCRRGAAEGSGSSSTECSPERSRRCTAAARRELRRRGGLLPSSESEEVVDRTTSATDLRAARTVALVLESGRGRGRLRAHLRPRVRAVLRGRS